MLDGEFDEPSMYYTILSTAMRSFQQHLPGTMLRYSLEHPRGKGSDPRLRCYPAMRLALHQYMVQMAMLRHRRGCFLWLMRARLWFLVLLLLLGLAHACQIRAAHRAYLDRAVR